jgi:hypothetical protein
MQCSPVGSATFIRETIKGELKMQTFKWTSSGHVESSAILYEDIVVVFAYKSSKVTSYTLTDVLQNVFESCDTSQMILVGDFNINFKNCSSLCKFTNRYDLKIILPDTSSTDGGTQIDICFSNVCSAVATYYESASSYHKPIWILI